MCVCVCVYEKLILPACEGNLNFSMLAISPRRLKISFPPCINNKQLWMQQIFTSYKVVLYFTPGVFYIARISIANIKCKNPLNLTSKLLHFFLLLSVSLKCPVVHIDFSALVCIGKVFLFWLDARNREHLSSCSKNDESSSDKSLWMLIACQKTTNIEQKVTVIDTRECSAKCTGSNRKERQSISDEWAYNITSNYLRSYIYAHCWQ